jgi:hypothetical protein
MLMIKKYFHNIIKVIKVICISFQKNKNNLSENSNEYYTNECYVRLVDFYHCEKLQSLVILIQLNDTNKLISHPLKSLINDKKLIRELHPIDASKIGILANFENHGLFKKIFSHLLEKNYFVSSANLIKKIKPFFRVTKKYLGDENIRIISMTTPCMQNSIEMSILDLFENYRILSSMDPFDTIALGYDISDYWIQKIFDNDYRYKKQY